MMQFIPATANQIAGELKLTNFAQDDLYNADTAILFGSQYLSNLLFPLAIVISLVHSFYLYNLGLIDIGAIVADRDGHGRSLARCGA